MFLCKGYKQTTVHFVREWIVSEVGSRAVVSPWSRQFSLMSDLKSNPIWFKNMPIYNADNDLKFLLMIKPVVYLLDSFIYAQG